MRNEVTMTYVSMTIILLKKKKSIQRQQVSDANRNSLEGRQKHKKKTYIILLSVARDFQNSRTNLTPTSLNNNN